jgi:hypothetical protein
MKKLLFFSMGILFGLFSGRVDYYASYVYHDHAGKISLVWLGIWLIIASAIVFYHKRRSLRKYSLRYIMLLLVLIQLASFGGMLLNRWLINDVTLENKETFLRNIFSNADNEQISFADTYENYKRETEVFSFMFFLEILANSLLLLLLSFIPIILIKKKEIRNATG